MPKARQRLEGSIFKSYNRAAWRKTFMYQNNNDNTFQRLFPLIELNGFCVCLSACRYNNQLSLFFSLLFEWHKTTFLLLFFMLFLLWHFLLFFLLVLFLAGHWPWPCQMVLSFKLWSTLLLFQFFFLCQTNKFYLQMNVIYRPRWWLCWLWGGDAALVSNCL